MEQGSLALGDARRKESAAERQARGDARRAWLEALAPSIVYTLAIGFAAGGQVTGIAARLEPHGLIATLAAVAAGLGAAGLIEGTGLAFAILARRAALAGQRAYAARSMMYLSTAAACALNAWGHWGSIWAYPCSLGSVVALVLWVVETAHRCADQLAAAKSAQRRQAAIRALATTAIRRSHGRRLAGIVTATMDPATLEQLAVSVVDPATVAETAISRYVAARDKTARGGRGWRFWRRSATPPPARHVTATVGGVAGSSQSLGPATQGATQSATHASVAGLPAAATAGLAAAAGGPDGGQLAVANTATDEEFWRSLEADLAGRDGGHVADLQPASGEDPWRYARPLMAVPDTATQRSSGGEDSTEVADLEAATRTAKRRGGKAAKRSTPADRVAAVWEKSPGVTAAECAAQARVGRRTAERYLAVLRRDAAAATADMAKAN